MTRIDRRAALGAAILREPSCIARIAEPGGSPPADFKPVIRGEFAKWSEVVRVPGARVE